MKQFFVTMAAILATGATLYVARKVPMIDKAAEIVTKGYGE